MVSILLKTTRRHECRRGKLKQVDKLNGELEARVAERTEQLREANRNLEALSYSIAHD